MEGLEELEGGRVDGLRSGRMEELKGWKGWKDVFAIVVDFCNYLTACYIKGTRTLE